MTRRASPHRRPLLDGPLVYDPRWRARHGHDDGSRCSDPKKHEYWRYFDLISSGALTPEQEARYGVSRVVWMNRQEGLPMSRPRIQRMYETYLRQARTRGRGRRGIAYRQNEDIARRWRQGGIRLSTLT